MKKIFILIIVIFITAVLIGGVLIWRYEQKPLPVLSLPTFATDLETVIITTDKTEYNQGEVVKITIKNNLERDICYFTPQGSDCYLTPYKVYQFYNEEWKLLKTGDPSIICIQVISSPICEELIESNKSQEFNWDQGVMENMCSEYEGKGECQIPAGKYKISFKIGDFGEIYSIEFTIKEKEIGAEAKNCNLYGIPMTEKEMEECTCLEGYKKFYCPTDAYCATDSQKPCTAHSDCPKNERCISNDGINWNCSGLICGCYYDNPSRPDEMVCVE